MKLRLLVAIAVLGLVPAAWCDDASKNAKVEELFRVSHMDQLLQQALKAAMDQVKSGVIQQILGAKPPDKEAAAFQDKIAAIVTNALSWDKVKPAYIKLYAEAYTEDELDGIVAFYKSPAGQAMVKKTPDLMGKSMTTVQQMIGDAQPELRKAIEDYAAQVHEKQ
jgi:uncharacterized protein